MDSQFILHPGGTPASIDSQLGFLARTIIVDNFTSQFVLIAGANQRVPPYTPGYIISLPAGTQQASASFAPPDGVTSPPMNSAESATVRYLDAQLAPSPQIGFTAGTPQQLLKTLPTGSPLSVSVTVPVPTGTQALALAWAANPLNNGPANITVVGHQSGIAYITVAPAQETLAGYSIALLLSALDASVDLAYTSMGVSTAPIELVAIFDLAAVDVLSALGNSNIPVSIVSQPIQVSGPSAGPVLELPGVPAGANILAGSVSADGATIITIPANRTWKGTVWVSGNSSGAGANPNVTVAGGTATPAAGTELADAVIGASTTAEASMVVPDIYVAAGGSSATLVGHISGANAYRAGASGILL